MPKTHRHTDQTLKVRPKGFLNGCVPNLPGSVANSCSVFAKGLAVRPHKVGAIKYELQKGQSIFSLEVSDEGEPYIREWVLRSIRRRIGFLTMKVEGVTCVRGQWFNQIHSKYKLQFSFVPGTKIPLPDTFLRNKADAMAACAAARILRHGFKDSPDGATTECS